MNKIFTVILAAILTVSFLTGCQATPEEDIVVQKDLEQMIEKAQATPDVSETPGMTLREQTGAPETLEYNLTESNMTVDVNADVNVPEGNEMSILRVQAGDFSQETFTSLWNELIGDTPMFHTSNEMTKSEIEAAIVFAKGKLEQAEDEDAAAYYQEQIDYFNSIYASVPEEHEQTAADGQLQELYIITYGSDEKITYTGIKATSEDGTIRFYLNNSYENRHGDITQAEFGFDKELDDTQEDGEPNIETYDVDLSDEDTPENAQELSLSPSDAKNKVDLFLSAADIPFIVRSGYLKKSADREYYSFSCARVVGDISCAQILGGTYSEDESGYIETWEYESFSICIDDSGITDVIWDYPIEIIETVVEDSTIKEFTDIQDIFNKMMFITYEYQAKGTEELICEVTDVRLEMMRINEQNVQRVGLLVPVWNFYGVRITKNEDGTSSETSKIILMSINAIDGSIIDTSKGY